jgi:predicted transcriptional regulator
VASRKQNQPPLRGQALRDETLNRLIGGEREVLRLLINRYPEALSLTEIQRLSGYAPTTLNRHVLDLRNHGLITKTNEGAFHASEELFR